MNAMSAAIAGAVSKVVNPENIDALVNNFGGTLKEGVSTARGALSGENIAKIKSDLGQVLKMMTKMEKA